MVFEHNGARMYYEAHGEAARALVLLHGWGATGENWLPVTRDFQTDYRVYVIDFPGFGKSPEPDGAWSVTEYMEIITAFIRDIAQGKCNMMAHSFGGRVALMLASQHPELIGKLVLTGGAGLMPKYSKKQKRVRALFELITNIADNRFTRRVFGDTRVNAARARARLLFGSADYKNASPRMREVFLKVLAQDLSDCLALVRAPTLLVWGENDTATPLWMGKEMESRIPDAGLVVFEGVGHFAYLDMYPRFKIVTQKFLLG